MKKLQLLLIACFTIFSMSAIGQDLKKEEIEKMAKSHTDKMHKNLSLSDEQKEKVHALHQEYVKKAHDLKEKHAEDKKAFESRMKDVHEGKDAEMKKVLTDEQYQKYSKKKTDYQLKHKHVKNLRKHKKELESVAK